MQKVSISLRQMQALGIWERAERPQTVYHMTPRKNLESIIKDGKILTGHDYICWFFEDLAQIPRYIKRTDALKGRTYRDYDGRYHTAPPLVPADTVVLKLTPRYSEPLYWYREAIPMKEGEAVDENGEPLTGEAFQGAVEAWKDFNNMRIAHYDPLKFKQNYEVLELEEILTQYPIE